AYVGAELPPGSHRIEVYFTGVHWANLASGIGWAGVLAGLLVAVRRRARRWARRGRRPRSVRRQSRPRTPVFTPAHAAIGAALFIAGLSAGRIGAAVRLWTAPVRFTVTAMDGLGVADAR